MARRFRVTLKLYSLDSMIAATGGSLTQFSAIIHGIGINANPVTGSEPLCANHFTESPSKKS